ncbi:hypothetical protein GLAREA_05634 [Glarea lozoyensis ATCC 20868]|uniref:Non-classical export protein 1 n=1 Tax=Glarea lozoyensis (strain ATCC 20868 / MF5171) TaxID=1116229 RepID=S3DWK5_GLAL2|nr:uncharacterized protein GLAREA_05634 [Glarea lozoyensis ATCC 20868]EPE36296.1 hypothetical protein GLAREA_05634 [Glarea lozoyensis ATCC 20868]
MELGPLLSPGPEVVQARKVVSVQESTITTKHTLFLTKSKMPAPTYIISKIGDPIFAMFIGLGAAATRINREEKEQGRSTQTTIDAGLRRLGIRKADSTKNV